MKWFYYRCEGEFVGVMSGAFKAENKEKAQEELNRWMRENPKLKYTLGLRSKG